MNALPPAAYVPTDELWLLTSYFNPTGYRTKRHNYDLFRQPIEASGLRLLTVECAFGEHPFELDAAPRVLQVRGRDVMWQKERLLNVALASLPASCRKVAWLDGDLLFTRPDWAIQTARLLDNYPVVQLFDRVIRLPRGHTAYQGQGDAWDSFAAVALRAPQQLLRGDFAAHGHTGFAWAARREVLAEVGLYDACIAGSGDHMMAHAFCGDWTSPCVERIIGENNRHRDWFTTWGRLLYPRIRARLGCVGGTVLHLWHGEIDQRRYVRRNQELATFAFDPAADLRVGASGCWEWNSAKPDLHRWACEYFGQRLEDGAPSLNPEEPTVPEDTIADVAERLDRCADRFHNAGDEQKEAAAHEAAEAVRACTNLEVALRIERAFLLACGVLEKSALPVRPRVGLNEATGQRYVAFNQNVRVGGTRGWRNYNPGYIPCSDRAVHYGAIGCDGTYAIFPDDIIGRAALGSWIRYHYPASPLRAALEQMLPPDEIDLETIDRLEKEGGIDPGMKTDDMDDDQFGRLVDALQADSSWTAGESYDFDSGTAPVWVESLQEQEDAGASEATGTDEAGTVPSDNS